MFRSSTPYEYQSQEDLYRGFLNNEYMEMAERRAEESNAEAELAVKRAVLDRAIDIFDASLEEDGLDSNAVYKRLFGAFETRNLFDDNDLDREFSRDLLHDLSKFMRGEEVDNKELIPQYNYIRERERELLDRELLAAPNASKAINDDIERFKERAHGTSSSINTITGGGLNRSKSLLEDINFVNRPGILPAVAMLAEANKEFFIDIFQLQNRTIQDYYITNIINRATAYRESIARGENPDKFSFNIRMAFNLEAPHDVGSMAGILGSNLGFYNKLMRLKDLYKDDIDINVLFADKKSHPKFIVTDNYAILGSQNLTAPVGKSVYQAGSNYEIIKVLHYKQEGYTPDELIEEIRAGRKSAKDIDAQSLLYLQARQVMKRTFNKPNEKNLSSEVSNIGGPVENFNFLKGTLEYIDGAGRRNDARMSMILNQVFLLQYEKDLMFGNKGLIKGEMGPHSQQLFDSRNQYINQKAQVFQKMQRQFLEMVIEGRGVAYVDIRTYRDKVQDPVMDKLSEVGLLKNYNYDLTKLVGDLAVGNTTKERINSLTAELKKYSYKGQALDESMAVQIMAMASGNIQSVNVAMQHGKEWLAEERDKSGKWVPIAAKSGSSNPNMYSGALANNEFEKDLTNWEIDFITANDKVRKLANVQRDRGTFGFGLSRNQEEEMMRDQANAFHEKVNDIRVRRIGQIEYSDVYQGGEWEKQVDRSRLMELHDRLKNLTSDLGVDNIMSVGINRDNHSRAISLSVRLDPSRLGVSGLGPISYKFTTLLNGAGRDEGYVMELNKSKMIGRTEVVNTSGVNLVTGFERDGKQLIVQHGQRVGLSPIESTIALLSSVAIEVGNQALINKPREEFDKYRGNYDAIGSMVVNYLLKMSGVNRKDISSLLDMDGGDLLYGIITKFENRFTGRDGGVLDKVRSLSNISLNDSNRNVQIRNLINTMKLMALNSGTSRAGVLVGGSNFDSSNSIISQFIALMGMDEFADLRYDVINANSNSFYRKGIEQGIKEVSNSKFEDRYLYGQINTYSGSQGSRKVPIYGFDRGRERDVRIINSQGGLASLALLNSPYAFGPSSDLGRGDLAFFSVAEGGGSREIGNIGDDLTNEALLPFHRHAGVGHLTLMDTIEDSGVGAILKVSEAADYAKTIQHLGGGFASKTGEDYVERLREMSGEDDTFLMFYFDRIGKASQINQRLKNVGGTRPLMDLTMEYQQLIDTMKAVKYKNKFSKGSVNVATSDQLRAAYLDDLRTGLKSIGKSSDLITSDYAIGAEIGQQLAPVLSAQLSKVVEDIRSQVMSEFNFSKEETYGGIGAEIFRAKLLNVNTHASMDRGMMASSRRHGSPIMLMQLSGAYSDWYYANPEYGGEDGMRQTFIDRSVKTVQGSKLRATISSSDLIDALGIDSWNIMNNVMRESGEIIAFDNEDRKTWVYRYDESKKEYIKKNVVDSRKQFPLIKDTIEKVVEKPSFSYVSATSSTASFFEENAREVLKDIRILSANLDSNEILVEVNYMRTLVQGGGRRTESSAGGLFKGVPIFTNMNGVLDEWIGQRGGSLTGANIRREQIQGIANPKNFKSYFFSHGAEILTQERDSKGNSKYLKALLNTDTRVLAASLLMSMGNRFGGGGSDEAMVALAESARRGDLGEYFKNRYQYIALNSGSTNALDIAKAFLKGINADPTGESLKVLSGKDSLTGDLGDLNVKSIGFIEYDDIARSLKGERGAANNLRDKLKLLLSDPTKGIINQEYLAMDKSGRGRELSIIAGGIDLMAQLITSKAITIPVADVLGDENTFRELAAIDGQAYRKIIESDRKDEYAQLLNYLANTSHIVGLLAPTAASQLKVPVSSKSKAYLEAQYLVPEAFSAQANVFKDSGNVAKLRDLVSTLLGAMMGGTGDEFVGATNKLQVFDLMDVYSRSPLFKSKMLGFYHSAIGSTGQFDSLRRRYELFGTIQVMMGSTSFNYTEQDKQMIANLIKSSKVGSMEDVKGLLGVLEKNQSRGQFETTLSLGIEGVMKEFEAVSTEYKLLSDKAEGISHAYSVIEGMSKSGMQRMGFSFPLLEIEGGKVRFNKAVKVYSFAPSAEDTRIVGEQYGDQMSEEIKIIMDVWEGLAVGTHVNKLLDKIAVMGDEGEVEVGLEAARDIIRWQDSAMNIFPLLHGGIAGTRLQQVMGNKTPMEGANFTAAGSLLVPNGVLVGMDAIQNKFGGKAAEDRKKALVILEDRIGKNTNRIIKTKRQLAELEAANPSIPWKGKDFREYMKNATKGELEAASRRNDLLKDLGYYNDHRRLLSAQHVMLHDGLGPKGTKQITRLIEESTKIREALSAATNNDDKERILLHIEDRLGHYQDLKVESSIREGDYFARLAAIAEMQILQVEALGRLGRNSGKYGDTTIEKMKANTLGLINAPSVIEGLRLGSGRKGMYMPKMRAESLAGEIRKGTMNVIDRFNDDKRSLNAQVIQENIDIVREQIKQYQTDLETKHGEFFLKSQLNQKIQDMYSRLDGFQSRLSKSSSPEELADIKHLLNSDLSRNFVELDLVRMNSFRASPIGNEFITYSKYDVFSLEDLNNRLQEKGFTMSFNIDRNKTLGLFHPIGFYTSQGGDFDGDSAAAIFEHSRRLDLQREHNSVIIRNIEESIIDVTNKISNETDPTKLADLNKALDKLESRKNKYINENRDLSVTLQQVEKTNSITEFKDKAASWVSNYLKIDKAFLEGKDTNVIFSFLEHARDLFDGMKNIVNKPMLEGLMAIGRDEKVVQDKGAFERLIISHSTGSDNNLYELLKTDNGLREDIRQNLVKAHQNKDGFDKGLTEYLGSLTQAQVGSDAIQKYQSRGLMGAGMNTENMEMMNKALAQAGSVILGKTYNTMAGLLYAESPMLAMAHALENDDPEGTLGNLVKRNIGDQGYQDLMQSAKYARGYSQEMGGFLQTVNQIMRDSIKPKDAAGFFRELNDKLDAYRKANEKDKDRIIQELVEDFGPGSGLKALVQLDNLVRHIEGLRREENDTNEKLANQELLRKFGINEESPEYKEYLRRLGYVNPNGTINASSSEGLEKHGNKNVVLAAYKTKMDLVSVTSAYAFEKGRGKELLYKGGRWNSPDSTGNTLYSIFKEDLESGLPQFKAIDEAITPLIDIAGRHLANPSLIPINTLNRDEAEYVDYIKSMIPAQHVSKYEEMDEIDKKYHAHVFLKTKGQTSHFAGDFGEKLISFAKFNANRAEAYGGNFMAGGKNLLLSKDSSFFNHLMAATSGKIDNETLAFFMNANVATFRRHTGKSNASIEDVLSAMNSMGNLNTSEESARMAELLAPALKDKEVAELMMARVRQTQYGMMSQTVLEMQRGASTDNLSEINEDDLVKHVQKLGASKETAREFVQRHLSYLLTKSIANPDSNGSELSQAEADLRQKMGRGYIAPNVRNQGSNINLGQHLKQTTSGLINKNSDIGLEIFALPLLAIAGQAIASGEVNPEIFQQAIGNSITALAYTRPYQFSGKTDLGKGITAASSIAAGTAFKARMAIQNQEDGDIGKALTGLAVREIAMNATIGLVSEKFTNVAARALGREKHTLDINTYEGIRGVAATALGGIASAVLGMLVGEGAKQIVNPSNPSVLEQTLKSAKEYLNRVKQVSNEELLDDNSNLESSNGIVEYITYRSYSGDPEINTATQQGLYAEDLDNEGVSETFQTDNTYDGYQTELSP